MGAAALFRYFFRKMRYSVIKNQKTRRIDSGSQNGPDKPEKKLTGSLSENLETLKAAFHNSSDLVVREFSFDHNRINAAVIYLEGLVNLRMINESII